MKNLLTIPIILFANFCIKAYGLEVDQTCNTEISGIIEDTLNINIRPDTGNVISSACKAYPDIPDLMIATYFRDEPDKKGNPVQDQKRYEILLVNLHSKAITSHFSQVIEEDAAIGIHENSLWIDTAPYRLSNQLRAFGILKHIGVNSSHCAEGRENDYLDLFTSDGAKLHKVLADFPLSFRLTKLDSSCEIVGEKEAHRSIRIGKKQANGYHDLIISTRVSPSKKTAYTQTLHYNGAQYETTVSEKKWLDWWWKH
ncbi:hypothetical protein EV700_2384 [Fluviicoccus keumensis]|uniref:Uncharacterized protein n=1 Tax=Fluviicoccus keumensis TaxID=1435465 RepID=A0A4Q7YL90_9GAMM|nr:hypothetical protein [Fluviicoccus keumensis]RZU38452.1 hypothetical protein EV700_2384 [Fluviicoccus keumensis]